MQNEYLCSLCLRVLDKVTLDENPAVRCYHMTIESRLRVYLLCCEACDAEMHSQIKQLLH